MNRRKDTERRKGNLSVSHVDRRRFNDRRLVSERRRHFRVPVIRDLAKQIELRFFPSTLETAIPAVITQLSSGGMTVVAFFPLVNERHLPSVIVDLPIIGIGQVEGKIIWFDKKDSTYILGVKFSRIAHEDAEKIKAMAYDYVDCNNKLFFGVKDVCFPKCNYKALCAKPEKD